MSQKRKRLFCQTHQEEAKWVCLDNNCARKILCDSCLNYNAHSSILDYDDYFNNL